MILKLFNRQKYKLLRTLLLVSLRAETWKYIISSIFFLLRPHILFFLLAKIKSFSHLYANKNLCAPVRTEIRARDKDLSSLSSSIHVLPLSRKQKFPVHILISPFNSLMHVMIYKMFTFRQKLSRGESGNEPPLIGAGARRKKKRQGERIAPLLFLPCLPPSISLSN